MILDVRKLNAQRKYEGEVRFECELDQSDVTLPMAQIASVVEATGEYQIFEDDAVEIRGKVRYLLRGACTRCLKQTEKWIEAEWNPVFVKGEPREDEYAYENGRIVPDESIKDAAMLGMPYTLLCDEECKGIPYQS